MCKKSIDITIELKYYMATIQKDKEEESSLSGVCRESLVGEKGSRWVNEYGLGVAYRTLNGKAMTVSPVNVIEYGSTRRGSDCEIAVN